MNKVTIKTSIKVEHQFDANYEAQKIIEEHITGYMSGALYTPENNEELWETMIEECSYILSKKFLDKTFTPMQYNETRNEIAKILYDLFKPFVNI